MKKRKGTIFLLSIAVSAALSGCGSTPRETSGENATPETGISAEASTEETTSETQEESQEEETQETPEPEEVPATAEVEPDGTVYGNTAGRYSSVPGMQGR